jgi:hypothetical protein
LLPPSPGTLEARVGAGVTSTTPIPKAVILFGPLVENVIFRSIEQRTVRRWGMLAWSW